MRKPQKSGRCAAKKEGAFPQVHFKWSRRTAANTVKHVTGEARRNPTKPPGRIASFTAGDDTCRVTLRNTDVR
jgi:hypothetical protein